MFSGTVASIYPGILLLSGSVVTAVDLKTNSVMYTSPSELSALTGAVLTTNSEVVLRSNAVSCGFPTHVCAPASVMTVSLSTGDAMSVYNFTHGVNENLLFDSNDGILVLNQETSSFSHKNYLVGLDVSYGSGRTQFNQSIPTNFGVGETVALAVCTRVGVEQRKVTRRLTLCVLFECLSTVKLWRTMTRRVLLSLPRSHTRPGWTNSSRTTQLFGSSIPSAASSSPRLLFQRIHSHSRPPSCRSFSL
mgnify:CR=1 FL=1